MVAIRHIDLATAEPTQNAEISPMARKAAVSSALGTSLEWIDFAAYGAISATVLPALFFPAMNPNSALLASFATFGVGFFARPAGGVIVSLLGDRYGRKRVLLFTLILMGAASFLIGALPTYESVGVWAPIGLVLLRFVQGFALGGEATGAQLLTLEHAPDNRRGLFGAFINMAAPLSQVLSNALLFAISAAMTAEQFLHFGWRIPFLLSVLLVFVGLYIRSKVEESPAFEQLKRSQAPVVAKEGHVVPKTSLLRDHGSMIVRLILFWAAPAACFWVVAVFSLSWMTKTVGVSAQTAFLCLMAANAVAVVTTFMGGMASDRFGRKPTLIALALIMFAISLTYFPLVATGNPILIFVAMAVFAGTIQAQSGILPAFFAEPFPTSVRYAGSAFAYTGANLLFAGPAPFVAAWLMGLSGGQVWVLTTLCFVLSTISFVSLLTIPESSKLSLNRED
ncbi:MFS transporter [Xanthobacter autotrophicus]|uniref:MFS transporter n=1 Tax=Xanthobacter autotrophicus TaxID=280 RepID=UPI0037264089